MNILYPLYVAFGFILSKMVHFLGSYGLVIFIFTVFLKALLIPFSFKSTKMMMKQQALQPEVDALQREYKNDRMAFQEAQMALYKKHNISMAGGCLPSLLGLAIIWPIFRIVSSPLTYISQVSFENLSKIAQYLFDAKLITSTQLDYLASNDIAINQALNKAPQALAHVVEQGWIGLGDILNLRFMGLDLGLIPSYKLSVLFGPESSAYLPLLIVPLVAVLSAFLTSYVMEITNPNYAKIKEAKLLAKKNPARSEIKDANQSSMKMMKYMMPIVTVITTFTAPAALGIYWIASNIMIVVQQLLIYYIYKKPTTNN